MTLPTTSDLFNVDNGHSYNLEKINRKREFEKLRKGGKVIATVYAIGNGVVKEETFGNFLGFARENNVIKIIEKGLKTVGYYHLLFWKPFIK